MISFDTTVDTLSLIHSVLGCFNNEVVMTFSPEGMSGSIIDPGNAALSKITVTPEAFSSYQCTEESKVGIDLVSVKKAIGMMKGDVHVEIRDNRVYTSGPGVGYDFVTLVIDTIKKAPDMPNLNLTGMVELPSVEFKAAVKAAGMVGDKTWFEITGDDLFFLTKGESDQIEKHFEGVVKITGEPGACKSLFSVDYLKDITEPLAKAETFNMWLGKDHPLKIDCHFSEQILAHFLIAPRMESE